MVENLNVLVLFGKVNDQGSLDLDYPRRWTEILRSFAGKRIMISVEDEPAVRTPGQNRYWHGYLIRPIAEHLGEVPSVVHQMAKDRVGLDTTTKLSPRQFEQACEEVRAWAATEFGMALLSPDEVNLERGTPFAEPDIAGITDVDGVL